MYNVPKRYVAIPKGHKECPSCGRFIPQNEKHKTVTRVVRVNNQYGDAGPGTRVEVEPASLNNAVLLATMSLEEHDMIAAERAKPKIAKKSNMAAMVDSYMVQAKAEVSSAIERGKQRLERERAQAIAAGTDVPKATAPVDLEKPSREYKEVD